MIIYINMSLTQTLKSLDEYYQKTPKYVVLDNKGTIYSMPFNYSDDTYSPGNWLFRYIRNINDYRMDIANPKVYINAGKSYAKTENDKGVAFFNKEDLTKSLAFIIPGYEIKTQITNNEIMDSIKVEFPSSTPGEKIGHFIIFEKKDIDSFKKDFLDSLGCDNSQKMATEKCKHWCQVDDVKSNCYQE